jgi:hypothetical protein
VIRFVMHWSVPTELSPTEKRVADRIRRSSRFFLFLREIRHELFDDAFQRELVALYAPRGQDPVPPALLAMVTLLQAYTGVSDAAAVDAAEMDLRWQLVLGTVGEQNAPFGQGSLVRFRARVIEGELDQRLLDRTVELARKSDKFGWKKLRVALDSSPLSGKGRVEDGWNLIGHAMMRLVAVLARVSGVDEAQIIEDTGATVLLGSSLKATLDIDWDDHAERSRTLARVVEQAEAVLGWAQAKAPQVIAAAEVASAVALLRKVIAQNTEPDPDVPGGRRVPDGVPPDRICSVGDPDERHGRKSSSKGFNGYKRHIATHVDVPIVLAAIALPANQPENEAVPTLVDLIAHLGTIDELFIDRGYVSNDRIAELNAQSVPIRCRPWPVNNRSGLFTKNDFKIDLRRREITCPAGQTINYSATDLRAVFGSKRCTPCTLRSECTTAKAGRTIVVHPQEALLRKLQHGVRTQAGRERLRLRVGVEHRLARIGMSQGQRSRYVGTRKNTFDLRRHASVANLLELQPAKAA